MLLTLLAAGWVIGGWSAARAQPVQANASGDFQSFIAAGRLEATAMFDLAFDTNGCVWIASSDGLHRYDGYEWRCFDTAHGLPSRYVRTVSVTPAGVLWVGTDHGAGTFDGQRFQWLAPPARLAGPSVRRILPQTDGSVWFCSDRWPQATLPGGLTVLRDGRWQAFRETNGLPSDHVYNYFQDSRGRGFALTDRGAAERTPEGWTLAIPEPVWDMVEPTNGCVIAFSGDRCYLRRDDRWEATPYPPLHATRHPPKSLCVTRQGDVLAYGLGRWTGQRFEPFGPLSMVDLIPEAIRLAPDGALWCVDPKFLGRWDTGPTAWREFLNLPPPRLALPSGDLVFASEYEAYVRQGEAFNPAPELVGPADRMKLDGAGRLWLWASNSIRCYRQASPISEFRPPGLRRAQGAAIDGQGNPWFYGEGKAGEWLVTWPTPGDWKQQPVPSLRQLRVRGACGDPTSGVWLTASSGPGQDTVFVHVDSRGQTVRRWRTDGFGGPDLLVDAETNLWAYGEGGLHLSPQGGASGWRRFGALDATLVLEALAGNDGAWFVFSGELGGKSGFGCYRRGQWRQVTTFMTLLVERGNAGNRTLPRTAYNARDHTLCFGGYNTIHVVPEGDLDRYRRVTLPEGRSLSSTMVLDAADTLWVGALAPGNQECVLAFRPDGVPPRALISSAPADVPAQGLWRIKVAGRKRFAPEREAHEFRFSWRFDERAWPPYMEFPADGIPVGDLPPGPHRFQVRAQDEGGQCQTAPTEAGLVVLSPPWQEQSWFGALVWGTVATILGLALVAVERARKLARANSLLNREIAERRRAETGLQAAHLELRSANQGLEERVRARTAELADANRTLREQIVERERVEAQQRQLQTQMLQAQKLESLGVLAGGIAHDFNNLLTTIMGHADLAASEPTTPSGVRESLGTILTTSRRAADLCLQLLAYSGRGRRQTQRLHLSALVRETVKLLELSISKQSRLSLDLAPELPWVEADATQLRQVVMNLVLNASEATGERPGVITVSTRPQQFNRSWLDASHCPGRLEEGEFVVFEVSDTGCGMDATTRARMFDPFFTTKFPGRGLGLAAVLGIVHGHSGAIRVESEVGRGTTFTILLPPSGVERVRWTPPPSPPPPRPPPTSKGTLLLVDDEPDVRAVGRLLLQRLGYDVLVARNGPEAVALLERDPREIVGAVLDWTMPQMDGVETFHALRRRRPGLQAVLASGCCERELAERFRREGLAGFVQKPYSMEDLTQVLYRLARSTSESHAE